MHSRKILAHCHCAHHKSDMYRHGNEPLTLLWKAMTRVVASRDFLLAWSLLPPLCKWRLSLFSDVTQRRVILSWRHFGITYSRNVGDYKTTLRNVWEERWFNEQGTGRVVRTSCGLEYFGGGTIASAVLLFLLLVIFTLLIPLTFNWTSFRLTQPAN